MLTVDTLNQEDRQMAAIIDALPDAVLLYAPLLSESGNILTDFQLRYCNEEVTRVLGVSREVLIGQTLLTSNLLAPETRMHFFKQLSEVFKTGVRQTESYYSPHLDKHLEAVRNKAMGGVISITRDRTQEVKTEKDLLTKERMFRNIINLSQDGVMLMEPIREKGVIIDFRISFCNEFAMEAGRLRADCLSHTLLELYPHLRGSEQFQWHQQVVESGEPMRFETSFRDHDGSLFGWFIVSLTWVDDVLISRFTDVSERKAHEDEIEAQRDLLNGILNASISAVFACETIRSTQDEIVDLRIVKINDAFTRANGYRPEEIEGRSFLSIFPNTRKVGIFDKYVEVITRQQPFTTEMTYQGEGIDGWFEISAAPWGREGVVISFSDITDRKKAQEQVAQTAHYVQQLIDAAPTGIFSLEPVRDKELQITAFRFKAVNTTLAAYVGQHPSALLGALHDDWFPEYRSNGAFEIYKQIAEQGGEVRFERHYSDERVDVWLDVTARAVDGDVLVSFHDFSAIKKLQLQLEDLVTQLRRSNEYLEEFAFAASHDLQEPLRKITLLSDSLSKSLTEVLTPEQRRQFEKIVIAAKRMRNLISDLLDFSQAGNDDIPFTRVDLSAVAEQVVQDLETVISETGAVMQIGDLPVVEGNERQLRQLLQNLISNALKYCKVDMVPQVNITCDLIRQGDEVYLQYSMLTAPAYYKISISDNGVGFDPKDAQRMFQVFQRLHASPDYKGTGIGLAIVKKVVQRHNGFVIPNGEPNVGATFNVFLPSRMNRS